MDVKAMIFFQTAGSLLLWKDFFILYMGKVCIKVYIEFPE